MVGHPKAAVRRRIGTHRHDVEVSFEYRRLAEEDEKVATLLFEQNQYRHAMYWIIQATEKYLRSKIFSIVDPKNQYFREKNRNHSVEDAAMFLAEVAPVDQQTRVHIKQQLHFFITQDVRFQALHNELRYPAYLERHGYFCSLSVGRADAQRLFDKLQWLKMFLRAI